MLCVVRWSIILLHKMCSCSLLHMAVRDTGLQLAAFDLSPSSSSSRQENTLTGLSTCTISFSWQCFLSEDLAVFSLLFISYPKRAKGFNRIKSATFLYLYLFICRIRKTLQKYNLPSPEEILENPQRTIEQNGLLMQIILDCTSYKINHQIRQSNQDLVQIERATQHYCFVLHQNRTEILKNIMQKGRQSIADCTFIELFPFFWNLTNIYKQANRILFLLCSAPDPFIKEIVLLFKVYTHT